MTELTQAQIAISKLTVSITGIEGRNCFEDFCTLTDSVDFVKKDCSVYYYADGSKLNSFCGSIKII
tara:strand:- start:397 stop:594 length:198 start_codon:yes stop_codon:yes gene_type:complete